MIPVSTESIIDFQPDNQSAGAIASPPPATSLMLAAAPQLVDVAAMKALPALEVDLPGLIKGGAKNFLECGGPDAYFGAPADATAEEGDRLFDIIAGATAATIESALI